MDLEFHQLDLRYRDLRVFDPASQSRLLLSLSQSGQRVPVLVVEGGGGRFVLIDGYRRVSALRKLCRDTVSAMVLSLPEPEALLFAYRLERCGRRSALEEGWLLKELASVHGMGREALSRALLRSTSWISRRLGLVEVLPESVQHAVRAGCVPAHAAMKSLLPLARANKGACEQLVQNLGGERISVRGMEILYGAWRRGDTTVRDRIVSLPLLYLASCEEIRRPDPPVPASLAEALRRDVAAIGAICRRVRGRLLRREEHADVARPSELARTWAEAQGAFADLCAVMEERLAGC
ncbi:MAG: ParB N-terminal domain-containing protein [Candidatus Desulforudis sp.]|nr:ParB N-terminal domain-containing protein [Desulforudis sp.]